MVQRTSKKSPAKATPAKRAAKATPAKRAAKATPAKRAAKATPAKRAAKATPAKRAAKATPAERLDNVWIVDPICPSVICPICGECCTDHDGGKQQCEHCLHVSLDLIEAPFWNYEDGDDDEEKKVDRNGDPWPYDPMDPPPGLVIYYVTNSDGMGGGTWTCCINYLTDKPKTSEEARARYFAKRDEFLRAYPNYTWENFGTPEMFEPAADAPADPEEQAAAPEPEVALGGEPPAPFEPVRSKRGRRKT